MILNSGSRPCFSGVMAGFLFSVLAASILGWLLARRVMAPVARLARQVRHRDQLLPVAPPLAPDYADDEVGQLAAAFDATLGYLRQALEARAFFYRGCQPRVTYAIDGDCLLLRATRGNRRTDRARSVSSCIKLRTPDQKSRNW